MLVAANPTGVTECSSVVSLPPGAAPFAVQTWDWYHAMSDGWLHWRIPHPDGRAVETVTEYGMLGKIGVNGYGVGVMLNMLHHRNDAARVAEGTIGYPVHLLSRRILDEARSFDDAWRIAQAPTSASTSLTVLDRAGAAADHRAVPRGPGAARPHRRGAGADQPLRLPRGCGRLPRGDDQRQHGDPPQEAGRGVRGLAAGDPGAGGRRDDRPRGGRRRDLPAPRPVDGHPCCRPGPSPPSRSTSTPDASTSAATAPAATATTPSRLSTGRAGRRSTGPGTARRPRRAPAACPAPSSRPPGPGSARPVPRSRPAGPRR